MELDIHQDEVLIATDGSLSSQIAATLATQIATHQNLKVKGLYVVNERYVLDRYSNVQPELGSNELPSSRVELIDLLKRKGEMALEWLENLCHSMQVPFEYEIVFGYVAEEIIRQSKTAKITAFGKKGFHRPGDGSHLGENFHQFIHQVHVPFIAGGKELRPVHSLLLGFNGSPSSCRALELAAMIGEAFQAKTYIAYVMKNGHARKMAQSLEETIQKSQLRNFEWLVLKGDPTEQLANVAVQLNTDLLFVGGGHPASMQDWISGSTLDRIMRNIRLTTLVG